MNDFENVIAEEYDNPKIIPCKLLPEGWYWKNWSDGSGSVKSPNENIYFSYDWTTGEYKIDDNSNWDFYLNENYSTGGYSVPSLSDFKRFAEKWINENILTKSKDSVMSKLEKYKNSSLSGISKPSFDVLQK